MMIWPLLLFGISVALLAAVLMVQHRIRTRRSSRLFGLARQMHMNYAPMDRFELATRLRRLPGWNEHTSDLFVRDVLYAAHGTDRRFVATAITRNTRDTGEACFIIACVEDLQDGSFVEIRPRTRVALSEVEAAYQRTLASLAS